MNEIEPARPRNLARQVLTGALSKPISMITAPVASGKSEILAQVAELAAEASLECALRVPRSGQGAELVTGLCDQIARRPQSSNGAGRWLILVDDFHRVSPQDAARLVETVVDATNVGLIVACDKPLAIPVAALRLQRKLAEYGLSELALTREEVRTLAWASPAEVMSRDFQLLMQATEGWVGAWRLIAERLSAGESVQRVAADFNTRFAGFADYFEEEILADLEADVATFITHFGLLSPLSVELSEVLAGPDGRRLWEDALRQCPFLSPVAGSGRALTAHPMFRHFLAERARRLEPVQFVETLHRAAEWFEARRDWPEVIECLIAAGDEDLVARKLRDNASEIFARYGDVTLLLGRGFVSERIVREMVPAIRPEAAFIQRRLEQESESAGPLPADASAADEFKVILTYFSCDRFDDLRPLAEAWLQKNTEDPVRRALVALMLSAACHSALDLRAMRRALEFGNAEMARSASPFLETWIAVQWALYHLEGARPAAARHALETVFDRPSVRGLMRNTLEMVLASVEYRLGRIDTATELIDRSLAPGTRHATPDTMILGWSTAARCALRNSGLDQALSLLEDAYAIAARRIGERGRLSLRLLACELCLQADPQGRAAFVRAELDQILANAAALPLNRAFQEQARMVAARLHFERGEAREATSLIQPILRRTEGSERVQRWAEANLLRIAIATAEGRPALACRVFWECEGATADMAIRQLFLDEAKLLRPTIGDLLKQVESSGFEARHRDLVRSLAAAAGAGVGEFAEEEREQPVDIKLTRVERRVMELVARGLSNKEISERLSSSVATVKWHLGNVFLKLDVKSRTAALSRLRTLNLLS